MLLVGSCCNTYPAFRAFRAESFFGVQTQGQSLASADAKRTQGGLVGRLFAQDLGQTNWRLS